GVVTAQLSSQPSGAGSAFAPPKSRSRAPARDDYSSAYLGYVSFARSATARSMSRVMNGSSELVIPNTSPSGAAIHPNPPRSTSGLVVIRQDGKVYAPETIAITRPPASHFSPEFRLVARGTAMM